MIYNFKEFCELLGGEHSKEGVMEKCFIRRGPKSGTTFEYYPDVSKVMVKSFSKVPFHRYGDAEWVKVYRVENGFSCEVESITFAENYRLGYVSCRSGELDVRVTLNEYPEKLEGTLYIGRNRFRISDPSTISKIFSKLG